MAADHVAADAQQVREEMADLPARRTLHNRCPATRASPDHRRNSQDRTDGRIHPASPSHHALDRAPSPPSGDACAHGTWRATAALKSHPIGRCARSRERVVAIRVRTTRAPTVPDLIAIADDRYSDRVDMDRRRVALGVLQPAQTPLNTSDITDTSPQRGSRAKDRSAVGDSTRLTAASPAQAGFYSPRGNLGGSGDGSRRPCRVPIRRRPARRGWSPPVGSEPLPPGDVCDASAV